MKSKLVTLGFFLPQLLWAQQMERISIDQARTAIGQDLHASIFFERTDRLVWCGLRINFGDGELRDVRVEQVPLSISKRYGAAGTYSISVEGKTLVRGLKTANGCAGKLMASQVVVFDPVLEQRAGEEAAERRRREVELEEREEKLRRDMEEFKRTAEAQAAQRSAEKKSAPRAKPPAAAASQSKAPRPI